MKKSGYRSILHIYLMFFLTLLIVIGFAAFFILSMITVRTPADSIARNHNRIITNTAAFSPDLLIQTVFADNLIRIFHEIR